MNIIPDVYEAYRLKMRENTVVESLYQIFEAQREEFPEATTKFQQIVKANNVTQLFNNTVVDNSRPSNIQQVIVQDKGKGKASASVETVKIFTGKITLDFLQYDKKYKNEKVFNTPKPSLTANNWDDMYSMLQARMKNGWEIGGISGIYLRAQKNKIKDKGKYIEKLLKDNILYDNVGRVKSGHKDPLYYRLTIEE